MITWTCLPPEATLELFAARLYLVTATDETGKALSCHIAEEDAGNTHILLSACNYIESLMRNST